MVPRCFHHQGWHCPRDSAHGTAPRWHRWRARLAQRARTALAANRSELSLCSAYKSEPVSGSSLFEEAGEGEGKELPDPSWSGLWELVED